MNDKDQEILQENRPELLIPQRRVMLVDASIELVQRFTEPQPVSEQASLTSDSIGRVVNNHFIPRAPGSYSDN